METLDRRQAGYPALLAKMQDPPARLWVDGRIDPEAPCVAIVGTRRASRYGVEAAHGLAAALARRGVCVVSGMALGIDAAAHRGALSVGGRTVAVLGTGVDVVYPGVHRALAREIAASGALVSEFEPGSPPQKHTFIRRNRIIAGLSTITVVVESPMGGGAMITADFACEQGRGVGAVPGRIDQRTSEGCHQLIKEGASLITCADDLFGELGFLISPGRMRLARDTASPPADAYEAAILTALAGGARRTLDELCAETALPAGRLAATLMALEVAGRVTKHPDATYES